MDPNATKLEILDKFKENDSEFEELSRVEEYDLLQSPRFKRFQRSSSSSPRSPPPSSGSSPTKPHNSENSIISFDSIPKLRPSHSNALLKTPSKRRFPLKQSNRQTPLKFVPSSPTNIQSNFTKPTVSLTPAQRFEKKPGKILTTSDILSSYEFKETVGRGAFANVYRAINKVTGDEVAVKEIFIEDDDNILELMQEIDLLKILKHKNIVKYHGFIRNEKKMLIFLEYCSGGSLRHLYKKTGPLTEKKVIELMKQVISGLIYLHEQGVVHRDVKAANILLTNNGDVKLTDFGVSTTVSTNTIKTFSIAGTPNWMAPEIISMDGTSTASDIWSMGATVVELLTGEPLYANLNEMAALHAIVTDKHPPIPDFISTQCKDFIMKCFEKQPKLRLTAKELSSHPWLQEYDNDKQEIQRLEHFDSVLKQDKSIERDFNSIKRFNTKKFLPMATGTFKNDQFDEFIDTELTFDMKVLEINDHPTNTKHTGKFDPISLTIEDELDTLKDKLFKEPSNFENASNFYNFLVNNPDQLNRCANEVMIFNTLQWAESNQANPKLLTLFLALLKMFTTVDTSSLVELGGLSQISKYLHRKNSSLVRTLASEILLMLFKNELNLKAFIQCGGLKSSLELLQEDYKEEKRLLLFVTSLLVSSFKSTKISKSAVLLILSSHTNFLDWVAVVLLQFMNFNDSKSSDQLIFVISELKLSKLFQIKPIFLNSMFKIYERLSLKNQAMIVDFLRNIDVTRFKESLELLKFMAKVAKKSIGPSQSDMNGVTNNRLLNMACCVIFSICHLDQSKQIELVKMDLIPVFKKILKSNLPSSEFVIPLICEFSFNSRVIPIIIQEDLFLSDYLNLLRDPIWQANAMDSLTSLNERVHNDKVSNLLLNDPKRSLVQAILLDNGLNYELFLEKLTKLLKTFNKSMQVNQIRLSLFQDSSIIDNLLDHISNRHKSDILVKINLLKLIKVLTVNNYDHPNYEKIIRFMDGLKSSKILLVDKLVQEILSLEDRRYSSSMLPPPTTILKRLISANGT
jgi:cell division control protein CDC15